MANLNDAPIGVFDSGIGGLTVLNALRQALPQESFVYLADTARIPYGTKSREAVIQYAQQICSQFIRHHRIKALVIACNTASAHALTTLQQEFSDIPVLGVIVPGATAAVHTTRNKHIAVIATEGAVRSRAYEGAIAALDKSIRVSSQACQLLVSLVEEGWLEGDITDSIIQRYLQPLFNGSNTPDTLVLGCTHFPLLKARIENYLGKNVSVVDSASNVAKEVFNLLEQRQLLSTVQSKPTQFLVTDSPQRFIATAGIFLGESLDENRVQHISV